VNEAEPFVRALLDDLVAEDPVLATDLGLTAGADRLPTWSASALSARVELLHGHEARLRGLLADEDAGTAIDAFAGVQVARRLLRDLELRRVHRRQPTKYLDVVRGLFPLLVRELGTLDERVDAVAGRLRAVPGLLEEARANLEPGLPAAAVAAALEYGRDLMDLVGPTVRAFAAGAGREGALDEASREASAALERFISYLGDELAPGASPECGAGSAVVADILRWEHVLDDPPDALVAYGRQTLAESRERMEEIAAELGHPNAAAAIAEIQTRTPRFEGLVAAYRRAVESARKYVVEHDIVSLPPDEELVVMATPTFLRSMLPFAAYEPPGPYAARQLGLYFVTPPPDGLGAAELTAAMRSHPWASFGTTGVHEAYPGHHLQLVAANRAPTLARRIAGIPDGGSLFIEGWAFYCEELMEREGFLADPAARLMRLNDQVWRACRVVIDLELHLGVMDLPEAVDFLAAQAHMNRREAELECRRYSEEPGQAMSYLLGKREVMRLAEDYREQRGGTLKRFHDELLSWGSLPPAVIAWGLGLRPRPPAAVVSS